MEENSIQLMPICNFKVNPLVADDNAACVSNTGGTGGFEPEPVS